MRLTHEVIAMALSEPFVSNKGATTTVQQTIVTLEWQGMRGYGTAIHAKDLGVTAATAKTALDACAGFFAGESPFHLARILAKVEVAAAGQATVTAAVDMALHDLLGKVCGQPIYRLWGLDGLAIPPTGISLGALPDDALVARAAELQAWPILKLKMTPVSNLEIIGRLRGVYSGRIWIDGNGAWDERQALDAAAVFHKYGVELLEQPIRPGASERLRFVTDRSPVPIIADEDCARREDVLRLAACAKGINIKLLKCGGLARARDMIVLARQSGLKVMLGCKTESALGITAMAHLAPLADFLDLDGHLDIVDDPFKGVAVATGRVTLPTGSGLGVVRQDIKP